MATEAQYAEFKAWKLAQQDALQKKLAATGLQPTVRQTWGGGDVGSGTEEVQNPEYVRAAEALRPQVDQEIPPPAWYQSQKSIMGVGVDPLMERFKKEMLPGYGRESKFGSFAKTTLGPAIGAASLVTLAAITGGAVAQVAGGAGAGAGAGAGGYAGVTGTGAALDAGMAGYTAELGAGGLVGTSLAGGGVAAAPILGAQTPGMGTLAGGGAAGGGAALGGAGGPGAATVSPWLQYGVPIAGTVLGGALNYAGQVQNADAIQDASSDALAVQQDAITQARADLEPFRLSGLQADAATRGYLGLPAPEDPTLADAYRLGSQKASERDTFGVAQLEADPVYQAAMVEKRNQIGQSAAARGNLFSGATGIDVSRATAGEVDRAYGRRYNTFSDWLNSMNVLAGRGQVTAGQVANLGSEAGQSAADTLRYQGALTGATRAAGYNALGSAVTDLGNIYGQANTPNPYPTGSWWDRNSLFSRY